MVLVDTTVTQLTRNSPAELPRTLATCETIACNDGSLTLFGSSGTYVVTGHCVSLTVPVTGKSMNVTIDKADTVTVSGSSITGVDNVCNNGIINLSNGSQDNAIRVHGHCAGLTVSGRRNNVAVENADTITVSGDNNKVTYLSGAPKITDRGRDTIFVGNS